MRVSRGMRTGVRTALIIIAVLALIVPLGVGIALFTAGLQTRVQETSVDLPDGIGDLSVAASTADVVVRADANATKPTAQLSYRGSKRPPQLDVRSRDKKTSVGLKRGGQHFGFSSMALTISLPTDMAKKVSLDLDGRNGRADVRGDYAAITGRADSGAIGVDAQAKSIDLAMKSGTIDARGRFDTAKFAIDSGQFDSRALSVKQKAELAVKSGTGDLDLSAGPVPTQGVSASTASGNSTILLPRPGSGDPAYGVRATNGSGDVRVKVPNPGPGQRWIPVNVNNKSGVTTVKYGTGGHGS